jgi:CRP/FNR family transcriptional regulator
MHVLSAVPSIFPRPPVSIPPTRSSLHEVADLLGVRDSLAFSNDEVYFDHVQARAGQRLHLAGQAFEHLYLVHTGFLKTALLDASGAEQVVAFPLHGDLIGTDGIATLHYPSETTALSDSTLVVLPMQVIRSLGRSHPHLAPALYEIGRAHV